MLNQFSRTQLLFREQGMAKLQRIRVAVFGISGVGGYAVEALARSGIGALDLIDDDRVCLDQPEPPAPRHPENRGPLQGGRRHSFSGNTSKADIGLLQTPSRSPMALRFNVRCSIIRR